MKPWAWIKLHWTTLNLIMCWHNRAHFDKWTASSSCDISVEIWCFLVRTFIYSISDLQVCLMNFSLEFVWNGIREKLNVNSVKVTWHKGNWYLCVKKINHILAYFCNKMQLITANRYNSLTPRFRGFPIVYEEFNRNITHTHKMK